MVETNGGVVLDRMVRTGACGRWWSAATLGGYPLGVLQLEAGLVAAPAARARAASAVAAVRAVNPGGVLRTTELVVEAGRAWLVVASVPTPTLADLLGSEVALDAGSAAGIAVDVAVGLANLHAAGLGHGGLTPDTVILTPAGAAKLAEVGVLSALRDAPVDAGTDLGSWARLAHELASVASGREARALRKAAATAQRRGLPEAARQLRDAASALPDFAGRESLAAWLASIQPHRDSSGLGRDGVEPGQDRIRSGQDPIRPGRDGPAPAHRLRRLLRAGRAAAAAAAAVILGAGGAFWWLVLRH
jgi:tRNA A-37 threonylcarbamoyl transferase component Bud32